MQARIEIMLAMSERMQENLNLRMGQFLKESDVKKEPKFILFILHLMGVGVKKQRLVHWFVFVLVVIIELWDIRRVLIMPVPAIIKFNDAIYIMSSLMCLLLFLTKRNEIKQAMDEIYSKVDTDDMKNVKRVELITSLISIGYYLFRICYQMKLDVQELNDDGGLLFNYFAVSLAVYWPLTILRVFWMACMDSLLATNVCIYATFFRAMHCLKVRHMERMKKLVQVDRSGSLSILMKMQELHQLFDSTFSPLLFINLCRTLNYTTDFVSYMMIYEVVNTPAAIAFFIGYELFVTLLDVWLLLSISFKQEDIRSQGQCISDSLVSLDTLGQSGQSGQKVSLLLALKMKEVFDEPATVWNFVAVTRHLIIATASSFTVLSVLMVQINNGALGEAHINRTL